MLSRVAGIALGLALLVPGALLAGETGSLDFSKAAVVLADGGGRIEQKAAAVLVEEVARRTGIELEIVPEWPVGTRPVVVLGLDARVSGLPGPLRGGLDGLAAPGDEGFRLMVRETPRRVAVVSGHDPRGVLYGVGRLLRQAVMTPGSVRLPAALSVSTTPRNPIRGHQLGNRDLNNTYDAWTPEQFDRYIRELALFGANSIELIPPDIADYPTTRSNRKLPAREMMIRLSRIIDSYGLDLWIWWPNVGKVGQGRLAPDHFRRTASMAKELEERDALFRALARVDALFVPGGDPGGLHPDELFPWLGRVAEVLQRHHPRARIWVSDQAMKTDPPWYAAYYAQVNRKPAWLGGVVFGPWGATPLPRMRELVDPALPIRRYPDISHTLIGQYPVPEWDRAFAMTLGREPIIPRPVFFEHVHDLLDEHAVGGITYSEGVSDDVNKFVWADQDWDPETPVEETLRDYARLLVDPSLTGALPRGLLALEENLAGPLIDNPQIGVTLGQWQAMERGASAEVRGNWRFQMGLLRAYYDAHVQRRLVRETELETRAREILRSAPRTGSLAAVGEAERVLSLGRETPVPPGYRGRCLELADALFQSIGLQLTVERHRGIRKGRGAFVDALDDPLNDAPWLLAQLERVRGLADEAERLAAIHEIVHRTDPGPGGRYDDLGSPQAMTGVLHRVDWREDPGTVRSPRTSFGILLRGMRRTHTVEPHEYEGRPVPLAWLRHVGTIFDTSLVWGYRDLDPTASYRLRVVYPGRVGGRARLVADDVHVLHDWMDVRQKPVVEVAVPHEASADGSLELSWTGSDADKGVQVAELVLIREGESSGELRTR